MTPATIGQNAYLLDSVKNSFEIRNGEKSVDELGFQPLMTKNSLLN